MYTHTLTYIHTYVYVVQSVALQAVPLSLMVRREVTANDAQWAMTQVQTLSLSFSPSLLIFLSLSPSLPL